MKVGMCSASPRPAPPSHGALLPTATIRLKPRAGPMTPPLRAILDTGSQVHILAAEWANEHLSRDIEEDHEVVVRGIGLASAVCSRGIVTAEVCDRYGKATCIELNLIFMKKVLGVEPAVKLASRAVEDRFTVSQLANPDYGTPREAEALLGVAACALLFEGRPVHLPDGLSAIDSKLGYLIMGGGEGLPGPTNALCRQARVLSAVQDSDTELSRLLQRLWEVKEQPAPSDFTPEEQLVQEEFACTHQRTANGRYVVLIPIDPFKLEQLGESRQLALARFKGLEGRFARDLDIRERYVQFMREYESDGHMQVADDSISRIMQLCPRRSSESCSTPRRTRPPEYPSTMYSSLDHDCRRTSLSSSCGFAWAESASPPT